MTSKMWKCTSFLQRRSKTYLSILTLCVFALLLGHKQIAHVYRTRDAEVNWFENVKSRFSSIPRRDSNPKLFDSKLFLQGANEISFQNFMSMNQNVITATKAVVMETKFIVSGDETIGQNLVRDQRTDVELKVENDIRLLKKLIRGIHDKMVIKNGTVKEFDISCTEKSVDGTEDILCMEPPKCLPQYKNPCWYSTKNQFRCLPYFQLIGMGKCASSDLFDRIVKHPDVIENNGERKKETWWWSWKRYGFGLKTRTQTESFQQYLHYFNAAKIHSDSKRPFITGDGTPMDLSDNSGWPSIPQNNGLSEPKYMTPHLISHLNPDVRLLVILRDPVERLFSDYFFHGIGNMTTEGFHKQVIHSIKLLHNCTLRASLRTCVYDRNFIVAETVRLHTGFYDIFLQDWFEVFPRKQFLIFKTENYSASVAEHMHKVYKFLDLRELPASTIDKIANATKQFETKLKKQAGKMKAETRQILQELYRPFNNQLSVLLNDTNFTW